MGLSKAQVIEKIGKKNWTCFITFMKGQTVEMGDDGKTSFFECDVDNFIHKMKTGKTYFWD